MARRIHCVLFDLDGTLLDTAPDMGGALNELLVAHGQPALPAATIRPRVSNGAAALVRLGFGEDLPEPEFERLRLGFLSLYAARLDRETQLFDGAAELLQRLESGGVPWGIVTNKPGWLTAPLLDSLGLAARAASVVSGDTLPTRKPHPDPLHHAARQIGVASADCVYVGDAERDMIAARAAGMRAVFARYGYLDAGSTDDFGAEHACASVPALHGWLEHEGLVAPPRRTPE